MTSERDDLFKIFDTIINNDDLWYKVTFEKTGVLDYKITAIDTHGTKYEWTEKSQ